MVIDIAMETCSEIRVMMYSRLKEYVDGLPFFDMHSHMAGFDEGGPVDDRRPRTLPQQLVNDYLAYLAGSCVDAPIPPLSRGGTGLGEGARRDFELIQPLLQQCRGLTTYAAIREGIRELYPFEGEDISMANFDAINAQVIEAYQRHGERAWQRQILKRAGVAKQVQICDFSYVAEHWASLPAEERFAQASVLMPSLRLDGFAFTGFVAQIQGAEKAMRILGVKPSNYAEHVAFCRRAIEVFQEKGGRSVKILSAYVRPLFFEEVPDEEAARLYARGLQQLNAAERKRLEDNLMWRMLEVAVERKLPLLVHTGYSNTPAWAEAQHLHNLVVSPCLKGLRIAFCHSSWPSEGPALIMARTYRGAYFDLTWTPLLSAEIGRRILSEAIDMVPLNKILMGTDCGCAEMFLGTVRLIRRILTGTLAQKVEEGQFGEEVAKRIARAILWDNPNEFHGLAAG